MITTNDKGEIIDKYKLLENQITDNYTNYTVKVNQYFDKENSTLLVTKNDLNRNVWILTLRAVQINTLGLNTE